MADLPEYTVDSETRIYYMQTIMNYCVIIMDIFITIYSRKKVTKLWSTFQDYDEKEREMSYARNEKTTKIYVWSVLIFNFIIWTMLNRLGMYAFMKPWIINVSYMIIYIGTAVSVSKFAGIVLLFGQRFRQLNEIAKDSLTVEARWKNVVPIIDTKTIERLHDELMITGETLESIYSWSLMAWLGNLSFHSVSVLYFVISWILANNFQWCIILCLLTWITILNAQLILLHFSCHYASTSVDEN